jgi:hypothetical protein
MHAYYVIITTLIVLAFATFLTTEIAAATSSSSDVNGDHFTISASIVQPPEKYIAILFFFVLGALLVAAFYILWKKNQLSTTGFGFACLTAVLLWAVSFVTLDTSSVGHLAVAGALFVSLVVALALYEFGRRHSPTFRVARLVLLAVMTVVVASLVVTVNVSSNIPGTSTVRHNVAASRASGVLEYLLLICLSAYLLLIPIPMPPR